MSTDILVSCMKIAESMIEQRKEEDEEELEEQDFMNVQREQAKKKANGDVASDEVEADHVSKVFTTLRPR